MLSQNPVQLTIRHTGPVQHITGVPVLAHLHEHTDHLLQVHLPTEVVLHRAAAVVETMAEAVIAVEVAVEAVEVHIPAVVEDQVEVRQEEVEAVLQVEVHLHRVADSFSEHT